MSRKHYQDNTAYQHYVVGFKIGEQKFIVHRSEQKTDDGEYDYSFEKEEITSGTGTKQTIGFELIENARDLIAKLKSPEMQPHLKGDLADEAGLEFLDVMLSSVPINRTRLQDYKV